jgi:1-phosphofructokinase
MPGDEAKEGGYLVVCLNPVIQKTLVFASLVKGEVNRSSEYRVDVAGKGVCCARVLGQVGRRAIHLSHLGGPTREWFLAMCAEDGIDIRWVESRSEIRCCATELVEEARPVREGTAEAIVEKLKSLLPLAATVMLSGTAAAGYPSGIMPRLARLSAEAGKRLVLDLKGPALVGCLPFRPAIVKPNLEELLETYAIRGHVARIGREIRDRSGALLVVTRGAKPTLHWDGAALRETPVVAVEALNPTGSGDSFNVGLATALAGGATIAEAVAEGSRLGALNAERLKPGSIA